MFAADQRGPVSSQALVSMITSGELHSSVLVWSDGMNDFVPAADVPDLASLIAAALAPPAPSEPALDSGEPDKMKIACQTYRDLLDMAVVDGAISPRQGEMLAVKKHALGLSPTDPEIIGMETELLGATLDALHAEQSDSPRSSAADAVSATLDGEHESTGEPQSLPVAPPELKHHLSPESPAVREEATVAASPPVPARTAELPVTTARSDTSKPAATGEVRPSSSAKTEAVGKPQSTTTKYVLQKPMKDGNKGCISQMALGCVWAFLIAFLAVIIVSILIWYSEDYNAGAARSEQEKQALIAQAKTKEEVAKQAEQQRLPLLVAPPALTHGNPVAPANAQAAQTPTAAPDVTSLSVPRPPQAELALVYLDAALKEVANIGDPYQVINALREIAQGKAKAGAIEASQAIFTQARKMALSLPTVYVQESVVALCDIAQSEAEAGDKDAARSTLAVAVAKSTENHDIFSRSMALSRVGQAQLIIGDSKDSRITFEQADKTASLQKGGNRDWCCIENAIIRAQAEAQSGNREAARQTLVTATALAHGVGSADLLTKIAQTQVGIGEVDGGQKTFREALDLAVRMKEIFAKGDVLKRLAKAQAESGDIVGANSTVARIKDRYEGAKYTYKEEALAAIGDAASAAAQTRLLTNIQRQSRDGGATTAESSVRTWTKAVDRCNGYIQIAFGLLKK